MTVKISISIPFFNQYNKIIKILDKILESNKFITEIIVIDDFSTDGFHEILKN